MIGCKEEVAVKELLKFDSVENYNETLDQFFEGWLTNDNTDSAKANERATRLEHLKVFKRFLKLIGEE